MPALLAGARAPWCSLPQACAVMRMGELGSTWPSVMSSEGHTSLASALCASRRYTWASRKRASAVASTPSTSSPPAGVGAEGGPEAVELQRRRVAIYRGRAGTPLQPCRTTAAQQPDSTSAPSAPHQPQTQRTLSALHQVGRLRHAAQQVDQDL